MTIRSTACALALIAGTMLSACELERTSQTSDSGPTETVEASPQASPEGAAPETTEDNTATDATAISSTGFGVHVGSYEPGEGFSASWEGGPQTVYFDPEPFITGEHVVRFSETQDSQGDPALGFSLNDEGAALMRETTGERIGQPLVLTLDGEVLSAPNINSAISRNGMVTGQGDADWIDSLKDALTEAGAEKADPDAQQDPEPDPAALGIGVFIASPDQRAQFRIGFPLLEDTMLYFDEEPLLIVDHFAGATITTDQAGNPALELELNDEGKAIMEARDEDYIGNYLITTWQGRAISASRVMRQLDDTIIVSNAGIDPDLAENWMAALDASLPE